ncbi:adenosylcobinamide amidohydrolase CbiZ [Paralimibaculum aggregatum]|uniref:Adenosylcobinamide amidohydrolase CbiZ n=1 Tax=Paralimibaculum aggregatum TaxID=3036245 RepID=A0ABQ6LQS6_9RHOB|nr:adenosylcobinamide amidohydrolase [Limibaculum sp. NKW23]GMG83558.1 adenosylcobinamide amidohydrolase CbiZ [Limibaculum sp. NKW23]
MQLTLARPWLVADLGAPMRALSWVLNRPGFAEVERIVWREVRNADLPEDLDPGAWFAAELAAAGHAGALGFITSRDLGCHAAASAEIEGIRAEAVATVGLSNAERVGQRRGSAVPEPAGTINIAVALDRPLADGALVEALSIAAEARTLAVLAHGPDLGGNRPTGTGTDCIAVAAALAQPGGPEPLAHAGLHTALGEAIGAAVLSAVGRGVRDWMRSFGEPHDG